MAEVEDLGGDISSLKDEDFAVIDNNKTTSPNPPSSEDQPASGLTPGEKRLRALKKKLQQIENLKEKREHGETLEKTQVRALFFLNANTISKQATSIDLQPTFCERNERRKSILMTCHYPDLGVLLDWSCLRGKFASTNQKHNTSSSVFFSGCKWQCKLSTPRARVSRLWLKNVDLVPAG